MGEQRSMSASASSDGLALFTTTHLSAPGPLTCVRQYGFVPDLTPSSLEWTVEAALGDLQHFAAGPPRRAPARLPVAVLPRSGSGSLPTLCPVVVFFVGEPGTWDFHPVDLTIDHRPAVREVHLGTSFYGVVSETHDAAWSHTQLRLRAAGEPELVIAVRDLHRVAIDTALTIAPGSVSTAMRDQVEAELALRALAR